MFDRRYMQLNVRTMVNNVDDLADGVQLQRSWCDIYIWRDAPRVTVILIGIMSC